MFNGLVRHARLRLQAQTGLSGAVVILAMIAAASAIAAFCFLCVAAFVWIATRYDAFTAGVVLGILFLLVTIVAAGLCVYSSKRAAEAARTEAASSAAQAGSLLDPRLLVIGLQIAQTIGLRRLLPVALVGVLAALGSREWFASREHKTEQPS
jgi:hypothetical protein